MTRRDSEVGFESVDESARTIVSIVWYSHRPVWHEVVYSDGDYEQATDLVTGRR